MKILTISGSLRTNSSNSNLLHAAARLAPQGMELTHYTELGALPHFNPDLDTDTPAAEVARFREALAEADGILISSPEYIHGVPGSLKNALDWVVSSSSFVKKPVVLINASTGGGEFAQPQLAETLRTMEADVLLGASLLGALVRKGFDSQGNLIDPQLEQTLRNSLKILEERIRNPIS